MLGPSLCMKKKMRVPHSPGCLTMMAFTRANSADPNKIPHVAASHQGLH